MAEYFPLLERAVSGLTEPTVEARRSLYERARSALIGQLSHMDPPVPEADIARESAALDEAIARVEARFDDHVRPPVADAAPTERSQRPSPSPRALRPPAPPAPALPRVEGGPRPAVETSPVAPSPVAAPTRVPPPALPTGAPPVVPPPSRDRPVLGARPDPAGSGPSVPAPSTPTARPTRAAPNRESPPARGTRPVMALRPVALPPGRDTGAPFAGPVDPPVATEPTAEAEVTVDEAAPLPGPRQDAIDALDALSGAASALDTAGRDAPVPDAGLGSPRPRDSMLRPPAPRPPDTPDWSRRALASILVAAALVMAGVGWAAYRLRDRPEQVVASRSATADASVAAAPGKVAGRASTADGTTDGAASQPASGAAVPPPIPQGVDTGTAAPSIAVEQRAALLVDAPEDPQRVRTYVGTVVWHLDSVSPGGGQPLASAVKADVDIPDAKLKVTMLMQKNPEPQLPASHTIEFHFLPQSGNSLGSIKQVNVPEMRKDDDAPTGDALAGVPVAITENYFLVGLTRGAAESQNVRLLTERNWIDMSVLFSSGKLGKLTFEKGSAGQRAIEDALKSWK